MQERAAEALRSGALQTYKQQISFGLHVIVMMGTFFAVGYIAGTALSANLAVVGLCCCSTIYRFPHMLFAQLRFRNIHTQLTPHTRRCTFAAAHRITLAVEC